MAVGDASVPAGNYANQALSTIGCFTDADGKTGKDSAGTDGSYDGTPLEGQVNLQSSVGNVCKQAQSGAVDVAFVYTSDVYRFGGVKVIGVVPADTHKNIIYPAAICKDSPQAGARQFIRWATTDAEAKKLAGVGLRAHFLKHAHIRYSDEKGWACVRPSFPCDKDALMNNTLFTRIAPAFPRFALLAACALAMAIAFRPRHRPCRAPTTKAISMRPTPRPEPPRLRRRRTTRLPTMP